MTDIYEYRREAIKHIEDLISIAGLQSYEVTNKIKEVSEKIPDLKDWANRLGTWRDEIYNSDDVVNIDKYKKVMNDFITAFMKEKYEKLMEDKQKEHQENLNWWTKYYQDLTNQAKANNEWWRKYYAGEHDWQKDIAKRKAENEKALNNSKNWEKEFDEKCKNDDIADIEMKLAKDNITDEALSKRLGVSDWRKKIKESSGWRQSLKAKGDLQDIIRKLRYRYICAKCGVTNEEFTVYQKGNKKYCSWDCEKTDEEKKDDSAKPEKKEKDNTKGTKVKKYQFKSFTTDDFFAWMKKMNVAKISFDTKTNQIVIELKNNEKLDIANSGLTIEQQQELAQQVKANEINYSDISEIETPRNLKNSNAGIIGAIVVVGAILFIGIIVLISRQNRRRD